MQAWLARFPKSARFSFVLGMLGLAGLCLASLYPSQSDNEIGIFVAPWVSPHEARRTLIGLDLPIIGSVLAGTVYVLSARDYANQRINLEELRANLPYGYLLVSTQATGCAPGDSEGDL